MFERLLQSLDHLFRWFIKKTLISYAFLCLWLLRRCFGRVPMFKLIPFAYAISAIAQILFVSITYGSLSLILMGTDHWLMTAVLLLLACLIRFRYRRYGLPALIGLLLLLPDPEIAISSRLLLCLLNWGVAYTAWRELLIARKQFQFKPFYMSSINEGSATVLHGTIHVVHVFVHAEQKWDHEEMRSARATASRALDWLVTQAERYKANVRFKQQVLWTSYANAIPKRRADEVKHLRFGDWLMELLKDQLTGFDDTANSNCFVIVHANHDLEQCLAYAVPRYILQDATVRLEYTVVGSPHDATVYAHEILHLFGADDLYMAAYDRKEEPMRRTLLQNCIMFDAKPDFSNTLVDDLTAENVGWL